jgi:aminomuconate-semialdehyde/2-hydroxymuconate-6-semialdehyde dehydrogenase
VPLTKIQNFINGQLVDPVGDRWLDDINPATGEVHATVPDSSTDDIANAYAAAAAAFPDWSALPTAARSARLMKLADLIEANHESLAIDESNDNGKPIGLSRTIDIPRAATNFRFFASAIAGFASESHAFTDGVNYTLRRPLGVVGCISPWNLPLYLFSWKVAPALAAGNCVIGKPSEITPLTAFRLSELAVEADLPPGVLNIVHGGGTTAGAALVAHPDVSAISFTGGTQTGAIIAGEVAPRFKKLSLELGGKNPNILFADCDYDEMLDTTVRSSFANQGQICLCGSRILIERSLVDRFRDDLVERASALKVGDPLQADTDLGAVVSAAHQQKIDSYVQLAMAEGASVLCGGAPVSVSGRCQNGCFYPPTVLEGLPNRCRTNQEEIFGPVVSLIPFDDEKEAVDMANDVPYGLSATVWTNNLGRGHRVADQVQAGVVWVNCWLIRDLRTPFGGMKSSGVGREGGNEALRFFTEPKNVCVKY